MSLRLREIDSQVATDRLSQRGARTACEDLQLAVGVGPLRVLVTTDQRLVHGHGGCPAVRLRKSRKKRVGTFLGSPRARPWTRLLLLNQPPHILTTTRDTCQQGNRASDEQPPRQPRRHSTPCPFPPSSLQYPLWIRGRVAFEITGHLEVFLHDSPSFIPPPPAALIGSVRIFRSDICRSLPWLLLHTSQTSKSKPFGTDPGSVGLFWSGRQAESRGRCGLDQLRSDRPGAAQGKDCLARFLDVLLHQLSPCPAHPGAARGEVQERAGDHWRALGEVRRREE